MSEEEATVEESRADGSVVLEPSVVSLLLKAVQLPTGEVIKHAREARIDVEFPAQAEWDLIPVHLCVDAWMPQIEKPNWQKRHPCSDCHSHLVYNESLPRHCLTMASFHAEFRQQVKQILNTKDLVRCDREAPGEEFIRSRPFLNALDRSTSKAKDPLTPLISEALLEEWMIGDIELPRFLVHLKPREPEPEGPENVDSSTDEDEQ